MNRNNLSEQKIVLEKILKDFKIAHFINQNFVLYGDWNYAKYRDIFDRNNKNSIIIDKSKIQQ